MTELNEPATPLPPEVADLLKRLETDAAFIAGRSRNASSLGVITKDITEAAARLEAQQAEIASLSSRLAEVEALAAVRGEALRPFAEVAADLPDHINDRVPVVLTTDADGNPADMVHIGDFRRAREAHGDSQ